MLLHVFLLWLVSIPLLVCSDPAPRGFLLSCGSSNETTLGSITYIPDDGFISVGNKTVVKSQNVSPELSTLRYFPDKNAKKYCYEFPVIQGGKYLIRTSYFYGGFDGGKEPPVFDQIIEGTKWATVNTKDDYAKGLTSYYEIVAAATGKKFSFCLARNKDTASDPFITLLELEYLEDSVYNSTDFTKYALNTVSRTTFGHTDTLIGYPEDQFNRYWHPFKDDNPIVDSHSKVDSSVFWNYPPASAFAHAITTSRGKTLKVKWPQMTLPSTVYYISLYFQDTRTLSPYSWRVFDVFINGKTFFSKLNATAKGVSVSSAQWPLSGQTEISLIPSQGVPVGPLINAGELLQLLPLSGRTLTRDVRGMEEIARSFNNPPSDWSGDPCLPNQHSWTGVTCSMGKYARVISLNLTNAGLSGSLPSSISHLTALTTLWLAGNQLSGTIPDMGTMKELKSLHLENNQFHGAIPESFSKLLHLVEISLENNKLSGGVPRALKSKPGLTIHA